MKTNQEWVSLIIRTAPFCIYILAPVLDNSLFCGVDEAFLGSLFCDFGIKSPARKTHLLEKSWLRHVWHTLFMVPALQLALPGKCIFAPSSRWWAGKVQLLFHRPWDHPLDSPIQSQLLLILSITNCRKVAAQIWVEIGNNIRESTHPGIPNSWCSPVLGQ
jgi:hypothetical protein